MMNKRAMNATDFIIGLIIGLIIVLISIPLLINYVINPIKGTSQCIDVHHGRCVPSAEGCHVTELKAPWSCANSECGKECVCCTGDEPYYNSETKGKTVSAGITVPQNMCDSEDKGLKCDESAAENYCKALADPNGNKLYDGYLGGSKICKCPTTDCTVGNMATSPTSPFTLYCSSSGSNLWIMSLICTKQATYPINLYLGTSNTPQASSFTINMGESYDFKVQSPDAVGGKKCTIYVMEDSSQNSINDATGQTMRFQEKDCVDKSFDFTFTPPLAYAGKTLYLDVILFKNGKEGSSREEDWLASAKYTITVGNLQKTLPQSVNGADCQTAGHHYFTINFDTSDYSVTMTPIYYPDGKPEEQYLHGCYFFVALPDQNCVDKTFTRSQDCEINAADSGNEYVGSRLTSPFKFCGAEYFINRETGEEKCHYYDITHRFVPNIQVDFNKNSGFIIHCQDGSVLCDEEGADAYSFSYALIDPTQTCGPGLAFTEQCCPEEWIAGNEVLPPSRKNLCLLVEYSGEQFYILKQNGWPP